jgi:glycosyltransferase involved in cell wall biosynthesis
VFEYMTLGIPFAAFDLTETRRASGDAAIYASGNDPRLLAAQLRRLVDDRDLRNTLADEGLARAAHLLNWDRERPRLLAAYDYALSKGQPSTIPAIAPEPAQ